VLCLPVSAAPAVDIPLLPLHGGVRGMYGRMRCCCCCALARAIAAWAQMLVNSTALPAD
jgi:hypothetical protein